MSNAEQRPSRAPRERTRAVVKIAPLVAVSGACALVYQIAWTRELRLVFGASTAASAAVLAIFMGGLGAGGVIFGERADRHRAPLALYARLELAVAAFAAITPLLVAAARSIYVRIGGEAQLGAGVATVARLALAALVLAPPTLAMGGTLPAASRAATNADDAGRRDLAVLYGANTLGAVAGATLATFVLLEMFGTKLTLWLACIINLLVAMGARTAAHALPERRAAHDASAQAAPDAGDPSAPTRVVLAASAIVGFAFLVMEIVWYRMLAPVLGGSSYTFGLVLAVALFGIGAGGAARAAWGSRRPATLHGFAASCALEALCMAIPFALGDRIAVLALLLRPLGGLGLAGLAAGWAVIASIVILPAAIVAGWQFPLLVALLGEGDRRLGRDVARAYAWNTAGAIAGSLAGGFGLLPVLSAPGVWRAAAALLAVTGVGSAVVAFYAHRSRARIVVVGSTAIAAIALLASRGPTAAWRHSAIGAGREADVMLKATPVTLRDWVRKKRREVAWEADGRESSIAMTKRDGYAFLVNGKVDGHARGDASTQVMGGLLGALLHPKPTRALVIGLGTGSSGGWLAAAPTMDRVDVVELERAVVRVARECAAVNHDALENPRLHLVFGDAREVLLVSRERYDVVFSEPSNPYRAGVSSLFTRELYRAVLSRLSDDGIFLQWLQAYEIDGQALRTAIATVASVFPAVEVWTTGPGDLLIVASRHAIAYDAATLRERMAVEPYRTAIARAWRVTDLEGVLAHFVARPSLTRAIADDEAEYLNTDDRTLLEFAFARTAGRAGIVDEDLLSTARARGEDRPDVNGGPVDWTLVEDERMGMSVEEGKKPSPPPGASHEQARRAAAYARHVLRDPVGVIATWTSQPREPLTLLELEMIGEALAEMGDRQAEPILERIRALEPIEADAILARLRLRQGKRAEAADAVVAAIEAYRTDPWPNPDLMRRALDDVVIGLAREPAAADRMFVALREPFALRMLESDRLRVRVELAVHGDFAKRCVEAIEPYEPDVPWGEALVLRAQCYRAAGDPRAVLAEHDLQELAEQEGRWLSADILSR